MMKRIYDWITKANQVLLFLVIIGGAILVLFAIYEGTRRYEPPHVSVAQTAEEAKGSVVQDVVFLGQSSGIYVLGIVKRVVTTNGGPLITRSMGSLGNEELRDSGETVNVIFSKGDQRIRTLLQKDGLVLFHNASSDSYGIGRTEHFPDKFKALLFLCVTEDTDGNQRLDQNDRNDLYVVSGGLEKPDIVVKGTLNHRVVSPTHVVIRTGERKAPQFWDLDTETQAMKEIIWK